MASCWTLVGLIVVALALIACGISFVAPYWVEQDGVIFGLSKGHYDLWASCDEKNENCDWYFSNDFAMEKTQQDWVVAAQGLFGFGVVTLLIGFLVMCVQLCCRCCGAKAYFCMQTMVVVLLAFAFLEIGVALGVYGAKAHYDKEVQLTGGVRFGWAFWVGVLGDALILIAVLIKGICSCRGRSHEGYMRGEAV